MKNEPGNGGTPATNATRPTFRVEKAIVLIPSTIGLIALTYVGWYRLPMLLWDWAQEVWWHWIPAVLAFAMLLPVTPVAIAGTVSVMKERPRTKHLFWWTAIGFLALVILALLILWAFLPAGSWWVSEYWWIWSVLVIAISSLAAGSRMFAAVQPVAARHERDTFSREWRFNQGDVNSPPALGIAMSGGGIRSAAFNLGVLQALHKSNILRSVDVMSAVSGGTYIMSWYLLQPFYAADVASRGNCTFEISDIMDEMFDSNGRFQTYLRANSQVIDPPGLGINAVVGATLEQPLRAVSSIGDEWDTFNRGGGVRANYRVGIQRLFHGHPLKDRPQEIDNPSATSRNHAKSATSFAYVKPVTYQELAKFAQENDLPFFIFNGAALVDRRFRHMLWPTVFELTADDLGTELCGYRRWDDLAESKSGQRRSLDQERSERERWLDMVNLAPAISGAAIGLARFDPKKRPWTMKLATWMLFIGNVDLGYLFPRKILNTDSAIYVSDGGHAENLGAYALIRRRCRTIVVVDAEQEDALRYLFDGYCKLRSRLKAEECLLLRVGVIDDYLAGKRKHPPPSVMTGKVVSADGLDPEEEPSLSVVYIKLGLDREHLDSFPPEVRQYAEKYVGFPQDSTSNQSYKPEQFTAYRDLGRHVGAAAAAKVKTLL